MELKPGYKQTEVGVIPEDWDVTALGEVVNKFINGGTPSTQHEAFWKGEIPWITGADILEQKVSEIRRFITKDAVKNSSTNIVGKGHLLLVSRTGVGKLAIAPYDIAISQDFTGIYTKSERLSTEFLFRFLDLNHLILTNQNQGTSILGITRETLSLLNIALPPTLAEQTAIAKALSDIDAFIESLEQLITKKSQIRQGALQELLQPKTGWIEKTIGTTATLKARIGWQGLTTAEYLDTGDYYLVTGTEFKNGYIDWDNCHFVAESRYKQDKNIQLNEHDVLVTKDGTIGKVALVTQLEKPATLNSGVFVIRPIDDAFHPVFFYYLLCSDLFTKFLGQLSAGSTINHLYQKDFVNFTYRTPATIAEQEDIAAILRDMDAEITALEGKLVKARLIKQGMMQELLTGRIRLV